MTKLASKWLMVGALVLITVLLLTTIDDRGLKLSRSEIKPGTSNDSWQHPQTAASSPSADLKFSYKKRSRSGSSPAIRSSLISQQALNETVAGLKKQIVLPFNIQVVLDDCGTADAYYDSDTREITVCYELIDGYYHLFSRRLRLRSARTEAAKGATVSIFLHELAHALIDGWQLPITGREEDAADQFATLMLLNGIPDGEQMALNGALSFELFADLQKGQNKALWDLHSLDEQRFYDTLCLIYGHSPEKYDYLITNGTLPEERAQFCKEDYERIESAWQTLLTPHVRSSREVIDNLFMEHAFVRK
jgi:Putative metallopeptidase